MAEEADNAAPKKFVQWIEYVNYDSRRDSASDLRNALLVVAALFITIAFQAGTNMPEHIFPQDNNSTISVRNQALYLACNTVLLSASMHIIQYLTVSLPFRWEISIAAWCLMATYGCSIGATELPKIYKFPILFIPMAVWAWRWVPVFTSSKDKVNPTSQP